MAIYTVAIYRELAEASQDHYGPDLAASLHRVARILASLGGPMRR
ncbi:MAG: hypothetical protein ACRDNZ_12380 [Streptosporangiaceae bacterium]